MEYPINKLDECIFDYLVQNMDNPKNLYQIYDDITHNTGHRCPELNKNDNDRFLSICYTLSHNYENIFKIFKNDVVYLIYSNIFNPNTMHLNDEIVIYYGPQFEHSLGKYNNNEEFLEYILSLTSNENDVAYDGSLLLYSIKTLNNELLCKLLSKFTKITDSDAQYLIKKALYNPDCTIISTLSNNFKITKRELDKTLFLKRDKKIFDIALKLSLQLAINENLNLQLIEEKEKYLNEYRENAFLTGKITNLNNRIKNNSTTYNFSVILLMFCVGVSYLFF